MINKNYKERQMFITLRNFIPAITLTLFTASSLQAKEDRPFNSEQTKAVESIIEKYFDEHPEAVEIALKKSLEKAQQKEQEQAKKNIIKYKEQIYDDTEAPIGGNQKGSISLIVFLDRKSTRLNSSH